MASLVLIPVSRQIPALHQGPQDLIRAVDRELTIVSQSALLADPNWHWAIN